jgi:hypothetical protein
MTSSQPDESITPTNKRSRQTQDGSSRDNKKATSNGNWRNPTPISNRFSSLQQDDDIVNQSTPGKEDTPKPPPIYITNVTSIPPLSQLLDQIVPKLYEIKALAQNQVKVQPKSSNSYRIITKALNDRNTPFHTYKPKEERTYRGVLKNMHYYIDPEEIKNEIARLGHKVSNIWNVKLYLAKQPLSMFFIDLLPAPNNKEIYNVEFLQQCKIRFEPP